MMLMQPDPPPSVAVAMLGARQHYAVPRLLNKAGLLDKFYTDLYAGNKTFISSFLAAIPSSIRPNLIEKFLGRADFELPSDKVVSFDAFGLWYAWRRKWAEQTNVNKGFHAYAGELFGKKVIQSNAIDADVLYGCNGASLELFAFAKRHGIRCILEQTSFPRRMIRAMIRQEEQRWPYWEAEGDIDNTQEIFEERESTEWQMADKILACSSIVMDGLIEERVSPIKCRYVPYGVPLERFNSNSLETRSSTGPLRILFAGRLGLRKGVPYLLEALRQLDTSTVETRFAGQVMLREEVLHPYQDLVTFLGPVPRARMADLYRWADVFILPSVCEAFGLVVYEALACGLPVIVTHNTGAPVRHEIDGLVVPIRNINALAHAIERFATDREFLRFCRHNVLADRERLGLDAYQQRVVQVIHEVVKDHTNGCDSQ